MKEELRKEFTRLLIPQDLNNAIESHKLITDVGFTVLLKHGNECSDTDWNHDANLLFQMAILKSLSLQQLSLPINYINEIDNSTLKNAYDPFAMFAIIRTQYEAFCNFNNIYLFSKSIDEIQLKYYMWVLSGLNYRQRFKTESEDTKKKKETEARQIEELINKVKANNCFLQLNEQSQKNILDCIKKRDWQIKVEGVNASKIAWHEMMTNAGTSDKLESHYSLLSLNTHPSNVSVFQFGTMYIQNMQEPTVTMALQLSIIYTSMLIRDYIVYFDLCEKIFNKLPLLPQMLINSCNALFRDEEYRLNDTNNMLN